MQNSNADDDETFIFKWLRYRLKGSQARPAKQEFAQAGQDLGAWLLSFYVASSLIIEDKPARLRF